MAKRKTHAGNRVYADKSSSPLPNDLNMQNDGMIIQHNPKTEGNYKTPPMHRRNVALDGRAIDMVHASSGGPMAGTSSSRDRHTNILDRYAQKSHFRGKGKK